MLMIPSENFSIYPKTAFFVSRKFSYLDLKCSLIMRNVMFAQVSVAHRRHL